MLPCIDRISWRRRRKCDQRALSMLVYQVIGVQHLLHAAIQASATMTAAHAYRRRRGRARSGMAPSSSCAWPCRACSSSPCKFNSNFNLSAAGYEMAVNGRRCSDACTAPHPYACNGAWCLRELLQHACSRLSALVCLQPPTACHDVNLKKRKITLTTHIDASELRCVPPLPALAIFGCVVVLRCGGGAALWQCLWCWWS
jgi:hypothetical protein